MGGSSKPADPKVTPFQEPAAPQNPVPNWFQGGSAGTGFRPDMGASASAFGQQPMQQAAPQPMAQPVQQAMEHPAPQQASTPPSMGQNFAPQDMGQIIPFSIPSRRDWMPTTQPGRGSFDLSNIFGGINDSLNSPFMQQLMGRMRDAPRYRNYTDTDPTKSTGADGMARFNPDRGVR